jgi:DNA modification methylase
MITPGPSTPEAGARLSPPSDRRIAVQYLPLSSLHPHPRNARHHGADSLSAIEKSIEKFGFVNPILALPDGTIIAGEGRWRAATAAGLSQVPVVVLDMSEQEALALLVVDNATTDLSTWAADLLGQIALDLKDTDVDLRGLADIDFDADKTEPPPDPGPQLDKAAELQAKWQVAAGDLWLVGEHRIICGDCTDPAVVARVMGGEKAALVHADPPYGMSKEADGIANDNLHAAKLDAFQMAWWLACRPQVLNNCSSYVWGVAEDLWRWWYRGGLRDSERLTLRNEIVWDKGHTQGMGGDGGRSYPNATERCLFFMLGEQGFNINADNYWEGWEPIRSALEEDCKKMGWGPADVRRICGVDSMYSHWFTRSQWAFIPEEHYKKLQAAAREHDAFKREHDAFKREHDELKREHDELKREFYATRAYFDNGHANMTDVWQFPVVVGEERFGHATPKPVAMMERAIRSSTPEGGMVLVPFLGTGPEFVACEQLGRRCRGVELEPKYVAVCLERLAGLGLTPIRT